MLLGKEDCSPFWWLHQYKVTPPGLPLPLPGYRPQSDFSDGPFSKWGCDLCICPLPLLFRLPSEKYLFHCCCPSGHIAVEASNTCEASTGPVPLVARWINRHNPVFRVRKLSCLQTYKPQSPERLSDTSTEHSRWGQVASSSDPSSSRCRHHSWCSSTNPWAGQGAGAHYAFREFKSKSGQELRCLDVWLLAPHCFWSHQDTHSNLPNTTRVPVGFWFMSPSTRRQNGWYGAVSPPRGPCLHHTFPSSPVIAYHWGNTSQPLCKHCLSSCLFSSSLPFTTGNSSSLSPTSTLAWALNRCPGLTALSVVLKTPGKGEGRLPFCSESRITKNLFISPLKSLKTPRHPYQYPHLLFPSSPYVPSKNPTKIPPYILNYSRVFYYF